MKGYKGFNKDLKCREKQYEVGKEYTEPEAELCENGLHFCEAPHHCFSYYGAGESRFCEVEANDADVSGKTDSDDSKRASKHLKIGVEIDASAICTIAVKGFFEWFKFGNKIEKAKESPETNAGDCGAANAGNCGAANAGDGGAANAGYRGAANAGDCGAANAGNYGAANAGYRGAAINRLKGTSSVGKKGVAICMDEGKAKGNTGSLLVMLCRDGDGNITDYVVAIVDDKTIKANTWYRLESGKAVEVPHD